LAEELTKAMRELAPFERAVHGISSFTHQLFHSTLALLELPARIGGGGMFEKGKGSEIEKILPAPPPAPPIPRALEEAIPDEIAIWRRFGRSR